MHFFKKSRKKIKKNSLRDKKNNNFYDIMYGKKACLGTAIVKHEREKMKKILGVSIVAMLAVSPMMAHAARTVTALGTKDTTASGNIATTSYVKGAYNVAANAINALITDTAVSGTHNYIQAGETVSANLGLLDANVKANADAIAALGGTGSIADQIQAGAQNADYDATKDDYANDTIGKAIHDNTAAISALDTNKQNEADSNVTSTALGNAGLTSDDLNTGHGVAANLIKVAGNVKDNAATIAGHTTTIGQHTTAINNHADAIDLLNGSATTSGSVAYAVKQLADGAVATNTAAIATLNGDASTDGSVAKQIATAVSNINTDLSAKQNESDSNVTSDALTAAQLTSADLTTGHDVAGNLVKVAQKAKNNATNINTINNKVIKVVSDWGDDTAVQVKISDLDAFQS